MTEVIFGQIFKTLQNITVKIGQNTVNTATAIKYKTELTYLISKRKKSKKC